MIARRYDEAVEHYKRALEMDPDFAQAHGLLGLTYSLQGRHEEALKEMRKIKKLENDAMALAWLGYVFAAAGEHDEAERVIERLKELSTRTYVSPLWEATVYAGVADSDRAFEAFDQVLNERAAGGATVLPANPLYDRLRVDARFAELLRRTHLSQ